MHFSLIANSFLLLSSFVHGMSYLHPDSAIEDTLLPLPTLISDNFTQGENASNNMSTNSAKRSHCSNRHDYEVNHDAAKKLTIIALSKETSNLQHWLFYHFLLGFTKVFIISNDCDEEPFQKLVRDVEEAYVPREFVEIVDDARCIKPMPQGMAYMWVNQCIQRAWRKQLPKNTQIRTAFIDTDEYLNIENDGMGLLVTANGKAYISENRTDNMLLDPGFPQWSVGWRSFGTSFLEEEPKGGTFLTSFIMRVPLLCDENVQTEVISDWTDTSQVRPCNRFYRGKTDFTAQPYLEKAICDADWFGQDHTGDPHFCYRGNSERDRLERTQSVNIGKMWINHYVTRSKSEWLAKIKRGRANSDNFEHIQNETKLIDYLSETVDLHVIEAVFKICRRSFTKFKESRKSNECCIHHLLGARGTGNLYANQTKIKLLEYCREDSKKEPRAYQVSCEFLLVGRMPSSENSCVGTCGEQLAKILHHGKHPHAVKHNASLNNFVIDGKLFGSLRKGEVVQQEDSTLSSSSNKPPYARKRKYKLPSKPSTRDEVDETKENVPHKSKLHSKQSTRDEVDETKESVPHKSKLHSKQSTRDEVDETKESVPHQSIFESELMSKKFGTKKWKASRLRKGQPKTPSV